MEVKRVSIFSKYYADIKDLMDKAFPSSERLPLNILYLFSLRSDIHYLCFIEDNQLIGVMYTIETKNLNYILHLAVNPNIRSKGYGSKMLEWVSFRSGKKPVSLDIEKPDDKASNNDQRLSRYKFYLKNNFKDTGYRIDYNGNSFMILANNDSFKPEYYRKLFKSFTFNMYKPHLTITNS